MLSLARLPLLLRQRSWTSGHSSTTGFHATRFVLHVTPTMAVAAARNANEAIVAARSVAERARAEAERAAERRRGEASLQFVLVSGACRGSARGSRPPRSGSCCSAAVASDRREDRPVLELRRGDHVAVRARRVSSSTTRPTSTWGTTSGSSTFPRRPASRPEGLPAGPRRERAATTRRDRAGRAPRDSVHHGRAGWPHPGRDMARRRRTDAHV